MESWGDLAKQLWWEMTPQTNYHGTPYTFNKFDDSKFLTGEGAFAHGAGHYSADLFDIADKYNISKLKVPESFVDRYDLPSKFLEFDKPTQEFSIKNKIHQLNTFASDTSYPKQMRQSWLIKARELNNFLDNLPYIKGNTYKVNVPNENFMLNMDKTLNNQPRYIKSAIKKFYNSKDIPNATKDIYKYLDMNDEYDTKNLYKWLAQDMVDHSYVDPYNNIVGEIKASKMLNKYGIKGIRTSGRRDGGINVTFTDKNIKMANTIPQQIRNRIPVQTLKKMARKLYNTPGVKHVFNFADKSMVPLMILEGIGFDQPVGQGSDQPPIYPVNNRLEGYIRYND